jgi:hypothetical protein
MKLRLLGILLACAAASPALAEPCALSADTGSIEQVPYDPFSAAATFADLRIPLRNDGSEACEALVYVAPLDGAPELRSGQHSLRYRDQGSQGAGTRAGELGPYSVRVLGQASETVSVPVIIDPNQVVPRGLYSGDLRVRAVSASGEPLALSLPIVTLRAEVPARVEMGVSGTATRILPQGRMAPPAVDFGIIEPGETERVFVNVWSNSSVSISISSENGGELRRDGRELGSPIRYRTSFDGQSVSLSAPHLTQRTPPLTIDGASYELAFTILPGGGQYAGVYRDIVTVTVNEN